MSVSPPLRRLSETSSSSKESLINAYEAEEERIINILSRKLEKLREEKIELENVLEAESESHVNRLSREISALRLAQQQVVNGSNGGSGTLSPVEMRQNGTMSDHSPEMILEAMRKENEQLRGKLVETERDYIRISRLNEIYREELIEHRRRLGLPVDNLIGLASVPDPYSQPLHRRASSSTGSSFALPQGTSIIASARVPIPRPPSQVHRPTTAISESPSTTPPSSTSASLSSPFPFSPAVVSTSNATNITTPASSNSLDGNAGTLPRALELTYPSVPPPSLASSFGDALVIASPVVSSRMQSTSAVAPVPIPRPIQRRDRDLSTSPIDSFGPLHNGRGPSLSPRASLHLNRRTSFERTAWVNEPGPSLSPIRTRSRIASIERGARVAETGSLLPRSRTGSTSGASGGIGVATSIPPGSETVEEEAVDVV